ncbi:MAG: ABC transporter substrate-binding protein [Acidocella sp.]|nr:ABC transporter substrate-binding protein [Acidocella sp.]
MQLPLRVFVVFALLLVFTIIALTPLPARADTTVPQTLTACSAMNRPPMEFFNDHQRPEGADIDLGNLLASRLGMRIKFINTPFGGLIPALLADHCDIILSQLFIKPPRLKVINEIPYMVSQVSYILKAGAPKLSGPEDLSGQKVSSVLGSTSVEVMKTTNVSLQAAHKPPIDIILFPDNISALQQLQFGRVAAYGVAYETGLYYANLEPKLFELGCPPFGRILTGIGIRKDQSALQTKITIALDALMRDGSYAAVFKKWHLEADMLPP